MRAIIQILSYILLIIASYFLGYIISKEAEKESKDIKKTVFLIKFILEFILCLAIILLFKLTNDGLIKTIEPKNTQIILGTISLLLIIFSIIFSNKLIKNINKTSKNNKKRKLENKSQSKNLNRKKTNKKTVFLYILPLYLSYSITITVIFYKLKIYTIIFPILIFLALIYSFIEAIQQKNKKTRKR